MVINASTSWDMSPFYRQNGSMSYTKSLYQEVRSENWDFLSPNQSGKWWLFKNILYVVLFTSTKKFVFHKLKIGHGDRVTNNEFLQTVLLHFEKMKSFCFKMSTLSILKQKKVISFQNELDVTHD